MTAQKSLIRSVGSRTPSPPYPARTGLDLSLSRKAHDQRPHFIRVSRQHLAHGAKRDTGRIPPDDLVHVLPKPAEVQVLQGDVDRLLRAVHRKLSDAAG